MKQTSLPTGMGFGTTFGLIAAAAAVYLLLQKKLLKTVVEEAESAAESVVDAVGLGPEDKATKALAQWWVDWRHPQKGLGGTSLEVGRFVRHLYAEYLTGDHEHPVVFKAAKDGDHSDDIIRKMNSAAKRAGFEGPFFRGMDDFTDWALNTPQWEEWSQS